MDGLVDRERCWLVGSVCETQDAGFEFLLDRLQNVLFLGSPRCYRLKIKIMHGC
jgi:hypothetical protein